MAARRLLAVMLVFLAISTVLAALAPRSSEPDPTTRETTTTTTTTHGAKPPGGALVHRLVRLEARHGALQARPERLKVHAGDQLVLSVRAPRVLTLELPSLGITETAGPDDPARIDLFLSAAGRHLLRDAASGRKLVRIEVLERMRQPARKGQNRGSRQ